MCGTVSEKGPTFYFFSTSTRRPSTALTRCSTLESTVSTWCSLGTVVYINNLERANIEPLLYSYSFTVLVSFQNGWPLFLRDNLTTRDPMLPTLTIMDSSLLMAFHTVFKPHSYHTFVLLKRQQVCSRQEQLLDVSRPLRTGLASDVSEVEPGGCKGPD